MKGVSKPHEDPEERQKRMRRANRFESSGMSLAERMAQSAPDRWNSGGAVASADHEGGDIELDFTVVGTSEELEKKYLRLTSAPDPRTVRPERVLKMTVEHIRSKIVRFDAEMCR